ncbi:MAG: hypothetical protein DUD27_00505 [Lachnospiraceae bacterium]|uniref:Flagellar protein FliT n=1 Tax=Candidatus Weimeria bifida TaxID=2599074 RepID=A0A6N7J0V3_9FIRM|nr:hypothetical protein [Candidatus Weimeria bifida]RRF97388.1 MAG: hypothetical protein DUD27_00505 [Lachnospiraceae bacterium]
MEDEAYVKVLRESLEKKVELLKLISHENEIQKTVLNDQTSTPDELQETMDHKDEWVNQISTLDDGFAVIFEKVKPLLTKQRDKYRDDIAAMKDLVREITDLTEKVKKQESENYTLVEQKFAGIRQQVKKIRKSQSAVSNYYKTMNGEYNSQFLDKSK